MIEDTVTGKETIDYFDIVIDSSGVYNNPNFVGLGGIVAPGERKARAVKSFLCKRDAFCYFFLK